MEIKIQSGSRNQSCKYTECLKFPLDDEPIDLSTPIALRFLEDTLVPIGGLLINEANSHFAQGRWEEAARAYRRAIALSPGDATTWRLLGLAEQNAGRLESARQVFERSLSLAPGSAETLILYAGVLNQLGDPKRGCEILQSLLARAPNLTIAWLVLGQSHEMLGHWPEAEAAYTRVLAEMPKLREARYGAAQATLRQGKVSAAEARTRSLLDDEPHCAQAWTLLGVVLSACARPNESIAPLERAISLAPNHASHSSLLMTLQAVDGVRPQQLLAAHQRWEEAYAKPLLPVSPPAFSARSRLRLGLVSGDFARHPVGFMLLPALESFDQSQCEVVCYSDRHLEDEYTCRFQAIGQWRKIAGLSDQDVARQIGEDAIDILMDLGGHAGKRLLVFARKPAPMQITWFGYVGTTGLSAIDYLIADTIHISAAEDGWYSEKVLRMPNGYACYGAPSYAPHVGPLPATSTGHITFGCLNNLSKYSSGNFDRWADLLRRVPRSRLLVKYNGLDASDVQEHLFRQLGARGVSKDCVQLEGGTTHEEFLDTYNRIDLALDTQPYSGGLTTCEALWMGVPVITCPGRTFAGRHATSHLTNAGYGQFVAANLAEYVELAVQWAGRVDELAVLRAGMREQVRSSPLCDAPRFARDLLSVLRQAWESRGAAANRPETA